MKIPNISGQYGGVGIKLKTEIWKMIKLAVILLAAAFFCLFLYDLVDRVFNGVFVDWFSDRYMMRRKELAADGTWHYYWQPDWSAVKRLLFRALFVTAILGAGLLYGLAHLFAKKEIRGWTDRTAGQIRRYMAQPEATEDIFPAESVSIALQMARIRAERQKSEQKAREEAQRKNDLITYLAHDLKTPLTSVIGYLSLLDEARELTAGQREKYIHISLEKAKRLEHLINEFFEITRYNLQQIILEKESVDLSFLLLQLSDEFYPLLKEHGNSIRQEIEKELYTYGDAAKLARVFQNLLTNAVAYSYEDTQILIEAQKQGEKIRVCIQNCGVTIPEQKINALFEKFYRLEDERSTHSGGAGLGLAIAKDIVELHGGSITAKSAAEKTAFTVELPAMERPESAVKTEKNADREVFYGKKGQA